MSAPRLLLYDILRLFIGPWVAAPRGIDRVDLAYAEHLFAGWPGDIQGVMPTPWGVRTYKRELVLRGIARLAEIWNEATPSDADPVLGAIKARLCGGAKADLPARRHSSPIGREMRLIAATGLPLGRAARRASEGAIYLNVGQLGWAAPFAMGWLEQRPDVRTVLMLHDAIPIAHPEFVSRSGAASHRQMMRIARRRITALITTSHAAEAEVREALGGPHVPGMAMPLPVAPAFLAPAGPDPELAAIDYCVVAGAIEPRKNHALLLAVWRLLIARGGLMPRLVVVGSPAHAARPLLAAMAGLAPHIIHAHGLSSPGLAVLLRSARALLMPSLAEGFGLPVQEALALGTPVIASDIPAHREAGCGLIRLLPTDDPAAWAAAVLDPPAPPAGYRPLSAEDYFAAVEDFLARLA